MSEAMSDTAHRVAIIQYPPVLLDRAATLRRAVELVDEAADGGAKLAVLPETFVPGYPAWVWRSRPGDFAIASALFARLQENAVDLSRDDLAPLRDAARSRGMTIVVGIDEIDGQFGRSTLYNTVVTIGDDGRILNRHRKLMPTNPERMVWGLGDASGLRAVDTNVGRVGALICWENYMPLARYALYSQGLDIYVAPTWDEGDGWVTTMKHIATEARCWVLGSGNCWLAKDIPADLPHRAALFPDDAEWVNSGDSVIISPAGKIVAGPLHEEYGILYADCDPARARAARRTLDVVGHYARPDVFSLQIDRRPATPIAFEDAAPVPKVTV